MKPNLVASAVVLALLPVLSAGAQTQPPPPTGQSREMTPVPPPSSPGVAPHENETIARKNLESSGYRDVRGIGANPDGTYSGKAIRDGREVTVTIDSHGNIQQR